MGVTALRLLMAVGVDEWTQAMRAGDHARAWKIEAETLAARDPASRDDPAMPYHLRWVWSGSAFDGRDVLVRCYHGLGDTLQFARFLPLLATRAARVTVEAQPSLVPLLRSAFPAIAFHPFDVAAPLPPREVDVEIGELPMALRARPQDVSGTYLRIRATALPAGTIGLCHIAGGWDAERSLPAALLEPIARAHPCVTLVAATTMLPVLNPAGCPFDMQETAALVAGCDLVVTVDTMIAHLAGALGRPTWLLLKRAPDWRWDPQARDTPWYPATRLYVQPRAGDWAAAVDRLRRDLSRRASASYERTCHGQPREPLGPGLLG